MNRINRIPTALVWTVCSILGWVVVAIFVLAIFGGVYSIGIAHSILTMPLVPSVAAHSILRP